MWYIYTLGYYSAIKKNEILPLAEHAWTWRLPYREKQISCDITYMWNLKKDKKTYSQNGNIHRHRKQTWLKKGKGREEG